MQDKTRILRSTSDISEVDRIVIPKIPLIKKLPKRLHTLPTSIFTPSQLKQEIEDFGKALSDPINRPAQEYIDQLLLDKVIKRIIVQSSTTKRELYTTSEASIYQIACCLKTGAYLSHATAAFIHQLIDKKHPIIYTSSENGVRHSNPSNELYQENIDSSFAKEQRKSATEFTYRKQPILLLSALSINGIGIEHKKQYDVTTKERTLLDMAVRPSYGGGSIVILEAYKKARPDISLEVLAEMLTRYEFVYPYHQAIGFYLQHAGYPEDLVDSLFHKNIHYTFYLEYAMNNPLFSKAWNIYYPQGMLNQV